MCHPVVDSYTTLEDVAREVSLVVYRPVTSNLATSDSTTACLTFRRQWRTDSDVLQVMSSDLESYDRSSTHLAFFSLTVAGRHQVGTAYWAMLVSVLSHLVVVILATADNSAESTVGSVKLVPTSSH